MNTFEWLKDTAREVCQLTPNLWEFVWQCLSDKTFYNGKTKLQYLQEKGYLPQLSESQLQEEIFHIFHTFYSLSLSGEYNLPYYSLEAEKVFKKVKKYLLYSWAAIVITAGDWSVDRMRAAESAHGLKNHGFSLFEQLLEKKYWREHKVHLHKWPWNGALMQELREERRWWQEIWIWDKLYFSLEDLIIPYINTRVCDENPFYGKILNILFKILKKWLKERWYTNTGTATIAKWEGVSPFCDLNDIFKVLKDILENPKNHFSKVFEEESWKLIISTDFEDDKKSSVSLEELIFLLKIFDFKNEPLYKRVKERFRQIQEEENEKMYIQYQRVNDIYDAVVRISEHFSQELSESTIESIYERAKILGISIPKKILTKDVKKHDWDRWIAQETEIFKIWSTELFKKKFWEYWSENGGEIQLGEKYLLRTFYKRIFSEDFYKKISWEDTGINLNSKLHFFPQNFVQGYFLDIPRYFSLLQSKIMLISATRSDSHECDVDFESDIRNNLELLAPWGCIITDGIRESFSRVFRMPEIRTLLEDTSEYKVSLVVSKSQRPLSILIQRKHPQQWFLEEEELREVYKKEVWFISIDTFIPYVEIISHVRERVLELTWKTNDIFKQEHTKIRKKVQELIEVKWIERFIDKIGRKEIESYYRDIEFLKEKLWWDLRMDILPHLRDGTKISEILEKKLEGKDVRDVWILLKDTVIQYLVRHKWRNSNMIDVAEAYNPLEYWLWVKEIILERIRLWDKDRLIDDEVKEEILIEMEKWIHEYFLSSKL